jgi:serine/threonine-protein kinase
MSPATGIPAQIGPYRVEREIARGGMGIVYLARDTRLDRPAAIKALPDDVASDPERLARFEREAKVLASLNHPNIAGIYGLEESGGRRYLALEHIEGETLATRIGRGPLPLAEALEVCSQIAAGVEAAHESGVIHRDLKPGNVMITPGEHVKVLDFGLAKGKVAEVGTVLPTSPTTPESPTVTSPVLPHSPTEISPATLPGVILGTAAYLSPEQARGKAVDRRTDIWSFGCVLYECLTGKRAFEGETVSDTIAKILERDVDWKSLPRNTPPRIRELLQRCLEKDPRKRLRDIGEARLALEGVRAGTTTATTTAGESPSLATNPITRWRHAMQNHGYLFAMGLVLGALIGINMFGHRGSTTAPPAHVSVSLPPGVHFTDVLSAMGGRAIVLAGTSRATKDAPPVARLYLRRMDGDTFEPIRGTEGAQGCVTSPDGRWILFAVASSEQSTQLHIDKMPIDGSSPPTSVPDGGVKWFATPVWLRSGDIVVSQDLGSRYARVPRDGSAAQTRRLEIPGFQGQVNATGIALPNDRGVLLETWSQQGSEMRVGTAVLDLKSGRAKILLKDGGTPRYAPSGHLLFARQGTLFAAPFDLARLEIKGEPVAILDGLYEPFTAMPGLFDIGADGTLFYPPASDAARDRKLVIIDRAGKVSDWSGEEKAFEAWIFPSRDGTRCGTSVVGDASASEIWVSERGSSSSHKLPANPGTNAYGGAWSPDGTRIAYSQTAGNSNDGIYVASVDEAGPPRRVCASSNPGDLRIVTSWSPDGTTLLAYGLDGITAISATAPPGTLAEAKPLFGDKLLRAVPMFSPDGRLIAYRSDETGVVETDVCRWDGHALVGRPLQVSAGGGGTPKWGPGGKLYYETAQAKMMVVDVVDTPVLRAGTPSAAWDLDALQVVNFRGVNRLCSILPDGRLLAVRRGQGEGDPTQINVVLNFTEELKERMRAAASK